MDTAVTVRALRKADAAEALVLYNELTLGPPQKDEAAFFHVLDHPGTWVFGLFCQDQLASMVTLHLMPNVLWDARPYGLIENVVTRAAFQRQGFGRQVMRVALDKAWQENAYKIMLMTGQKRGATGFYEALGFSGEDKHAMVIRRP